MAKPRRQFTKQQKSEAVGYALTMGSRLAAQRTGCPRRLIDNWVKDPALLDMAKQADDQMVQRLSEVMSEGIDAVRLGLQDPKASLQGKAQALRVVTEARALLSGGATQRTEAKQLTVTVPERSALPDDERKMLEAVYRRLEEDERKHVG